MGNMLCAAVLRQKKHIAVQWGKRRLVGQAAIVVESGSKGLAGAQPFSKQVHTMGRWESVAQAGAVDPSSALLVAQLHESVRLPLHCWEVCDMQGAFRPNAQRVTKSEGGWQPVAPQGQKEQRGGALCHSVCSTMSTWWVQRRKLTLCMQRGTRSTNSKNGPKCALDVCFFCGGAPTRHQNI